MCIRDSGGTDRFARICCGAAYGRQQAEVTGLYEGIAPAIRSGEPLMTRSADNNSLRLDLSGIREEMKASNVYELPEKELQYQSPVATRGFFPICSKR